MSSTLSCSQDNGNTDWGVNLKVCCVNNNIIILKKYTKFFDNNLAIWLWETMNYYNLASEKISAGDYISLTLEGLILLTKYFYLFYFIMNNNSIIMICQI